MLEGISPDEKIIVRDEIFGDRECYISSLDVQKGTLYVYDDPAEKKRGNGYVITGIDLRNIDKITPVK